MYSLLPQTLLLSKALTFSLSPSPQISPSLPLHSLLSPQTPSQPSNSPPDRPSAVGSDDVRGALGGDPPRGVPVRRPLAPEPPQPEGAAPPRLHLPIRCSLLPGPRSRRRSTLSRRQQGGAAGEMRENHYAARRRPLAVGDSAEGTAVDVGIGLRPPLLTCE